jgi:hypothetical protein
LQLRVVIISLHQHFLYSVDALVDFL